MENYSSVQTTRKSRSPHVSRNTNGTNNGLGNECVKKGSSSTQKTTDLKREFSPKGGESSESKKKEGCAPRRPSTVSGAFGKKAEFEEKERNPGIPTSKSFSAQPRNTFDSSPEGRGGSTSPSTKLKKQCLGKKKARSPAKSSYRIDCTEDSEFTSLLPQAVYEQGQIIETLSGAREELREKMAEKVKSRAAAGANFTGDFAGSFSPEPSNATNFENSYSGTLEEIFQAWVNLFYFIINLKINLVRLVKTASTEPFRPDSETEREIVGQAIECVKFFSKLKIKSLANAVEELCFPNEHNVSEILIKDYEERVSSPFLREMDFIQKKAKEILEQTKTKKGEQFPKPCD